MPSAEELAAAGMTQEAADALRNEYLRQTGQLPAAGGSENGGPGGPGYDPGQNENPDETPPGKEKQANPEYDRNIRYIISQIGQAPNIESAYNAMQSFLNSPYYEYAKEMRPDLLDAIRNAFQRHAPSTPVDSWFGR